MSNGACPDCKEHSGMVAKLEAGEQKFEHINGTLETFKEDMKQIANSFGETAREFKESLKEISDRFGTIINGDAEKKIKGHEERIGTLEASQARLYKIVGTLLSVGGIVVGYFAKMFWSKMSDVMAAIEAINKVVE